MKKLSLKNSYTILIILIVLCYSLLNLLAYQASLRTTTSLDLTENKLYELSDITKDLMENLDAEINLHVFASKEEFPSMLVEILNRYEKLSDLFNVNYQDIYENPVLFEEYRAKGMTIGESDLVLSKGELNRHIPFKSLLTYSGPDVTGIQLEQVLSSSILTIGQDSSKVLFSKGHGEMNSSSLESLFTQNYFTSTHDQITKDLNPDIIVIASPKADITKAELTNLESYLDQGGHLMVFLDAGVPYLTNLEKLLEDYNIKIKPEVVLEERAYLGNNPLDIIPMFLSHDITSYFASNKVYTAFPSSRVIEITDKVQESIKTTALLSSTPDSYAKISIGNSTAKTPEDLNGPFTLAALAEKNNGGSILAISSVGSISQDLLTSSAYANGLFFSRTIGYLTENDNILDIEPKNMTLEPLVINKISALIIAAIFVILLPLAILSYGIYISYRRKRF